MSNIKDWSGIPDNNSSAPPLGAPENATFIADCNNIDRQLMADVRLQCEDQGWFNWGHVAQNTGSNSFSVETDLTAIYSVGRKVRVEDATTVYGEITDSQYVAPNTQITIDVGGLTAAMNGQKVSTGIPGESVESTTIISDIQPLLDGKIDLINPTTENNAVVQDNAGMVKDAGVPLATVAVDVVPLNVPLPISSSGANNGVTAHGITDWDIFQVSLVSKIGTSGFNVGEKVSIATFGWGNDSRSQTNVGFTVRVDDTNVTLTQAYDSGGSGNLNVLGGQTNEVQINSTNFDAEAVFIKFGVLTP